MLWDSLTDEYRRFRHTARPEHDVPVIQAPVFGAEGTTEFEPVVSGFGPGADAERRRRIVTEALACSAELTCMIGGAQPKVIGEPQRAFYGNQFGNTFPLFEHYGVSLGAGSPRAAVDHPAWFALVASATWARSRP
ncbi:hypothetical protein [Actinomadura sp. 3N407]|uniref:hypothetical protein n=1 Tax=Actinomadura sp. 3N407 TaxID=3457423 RepID=UPI003FCE9985